MDVWTGPHQVLAEFEKKSYLRSSIFDENVERFCEKMANEVRAWAQNDLSTPVLKATGAPKES